MSLHSAVAADLAALTGSLDDPTVDITDLVMDLDAAVSRAVDSSVGLTVSVSDGTQPVVISTRTTDRDAAVGVLGPVAASLRLRSPAPVGGDELPSVTATLTFYAATAGAFVDLAADIVWLTACPVSDVVLDADLDDPVVVPSGATRELSVVNQAVGVLIAGGSLPVEALAELDAWAGTHAGTRAAAARNILDGLPGAR